MNRGFAGLLTGGVVFFREFFVSWLSFCEGFIFKFWFVRFSRGCELLSMLSLLGFLIWFEFTLRFSDLLKGFVNNDFLIEFSILGFPFTDGISGDLASLFCL